MSAVSSRPRVRSVTSRAIQAGTIDGVAVGTVVATALRALAREVLAELPTVESARVDQLAAGPEVSARLARLREEAHSLIVCGNAGAVAAAQTATLRAIAQTPVVVQATAVTPHLERVLAAASVEAVWRAQSELVEAVKSEHLRILGEALVASCRQASVDAGFPTVQTASGIGGVFRVVATDEVGQALVTEVRQGDDTRPPSIETEVVGVTDGRCQAILDRFDAALEAHGVRSDGPPDRKWTGGVCELGLAREFIRKKISPAIGPATSRPRVPRSGRRRSAGKLLRQG